MLAVVIGLILVGAGTGAVVTAHRAQPVQVTGAIDLYQVKTCPGNKRSGYSIVLAQDSRTYSTCLARFRALLLPLQVEKGTHAVLWIDQGSTDILGLRLGAGEGGAPTYASRYLAHPDQLGSDQRFMGALLIVFGVLAVAMGVGLVRLGRRPGASP